jgi:hypothetical protein
MEIYLSINSRDTGSIAAITQANPDVVYLRDQQQATPLAAAIKENSTSCVSALLKAGAVSSVFVHGYADGSLVCTLPMAVQPPSSAFQHPEPLRDVDPSIIEALDECLSDHVKQMVADEEAEATRIRLAEEKEKKRKAAPSTATGAQSATTAAASAPFNHYPPSLNAGDIGKFLILFFSFMNCKQYPVVCLY